MSLVRRLNLRIAGLFVLLLLASAVLVIRNARHAVHAEMESTASLALQVVEAVEVDALDADRTSLLPKLSNKINSLGKTRHVRLELIRGGRPAGMLAPGMTGTAAPRWFSALIAPASLEHRRSVKLADGNAYDVVLRTEPADEVSEAWGDVRGLMGLLFGFSIIAAP